MTSRRRSPSAEARLDTPVKDSQLSPAIVGESSSFTSHEEARWEPLQTFTLFPALPKELRDIIWYLAFPRPRIVPVEFIGVTRLSKIKTGRDETLQPPSALRGQLNNTGTHLVRPELVFVCKESRAIELQAYERCFSYTATQALKPLPRTRRGVGHRRRKAAVRTLEIAFRPAVDTVYIRDDVERSTNPILDVIKDELASGRIRSLALHDSLLMHGQFWNAALPSYFFLLIANRLNHQYVPGTWNCDVDEVICLRGSPEDPTTSYRNFEYAFEGFVREQFQLRSVRKGFPRVKFLTLEKFKELPRWKGQLEE